MRWLSENGFHTLYHTRPFKEYTRCCSHHSTEQWKQNGSKDCCAKVPNGSILNCTSYHPTTNLSLACFETIHVLLHFHYGQCLLVDFVATEWFDHCMLFFPCRFKSLWWNWQKMVLARYVQRISVLEWNYFRCHETIRFSPNWTAWHVFVVLVKQQRCTTPNCL